MVYNIQFERVISKQKGELRPKKSVLRKRQAKSKEMCIILEVDDSKGKYGQFSLLEIRKYIYMKYEK